MIMNTLEHLLEIETSAAALVNDAQEEADRRIRENEEKNRIEHEERIKSVLKEHQAQFEKEKEIINVDYRNALDDYKKEIALINVNEQEFSGLLNKYINEG